MDSAGSGPYPRRGDRLFTGQTLYFVLFARQVKRRDVNACPRTRMLVMRAQDLTEGLEEMLLRTAIRGHLESRLFSFFWYPRSKRRMTFEQYMEGRHAH